MGGGTATVQPTKLSETVHDMATAAYYAGNAAAVVSAASFAGGISAPAGAFFAGAAAGFYIGAAGYEAFSTYLKNHGR